MAIDTAGDLIVYKPQHKLINNGGSVLWLPPSCFKAVTPLKAPNVYAQSALQEYPINTKLEFADGRVFRYGRWGETDTQGPTARMVFNDNLVGGSASTDGYEGTLDATSPVAIGSTKLVMNDGTDRIENVYEDADLFIWETTHYAGYRVAGNLAALSVNDVTIYLADPNGLKKTLTVNSTVINCHQSLFNNLKTAGRSGYCSAMGVILADTMTDNYFGWVQRRGRAMVTPVGWFGGAARERLCMAWDVDGTMCQPSYAGAVASPDAGGQIIGYLCNRTVLGYDDNEVFLTLE